MDFEITVEDERPKRISQARFPDAKKVFRLFGNYPKVWEINTHFCANAQGLHDTYGMEELTEQMTWYQKNRHREFCPQFDDPIQWAVKYAAISRFFDKITA